MMKPIKSFGSLRLTLALLLSLAVIAVLGTLIPQGQENLPENLWGDILLFLQLNNIYGSVVFCALFVLLGLNLCVCVINSLHGLCRVGLKKTALFILHFSVLVIFSGAVISKTSRFNEQRMLGAGEKLKIGSKGKEVILKKFEVEYYPGTVCPKDYRSQVYVFNNNKLFLEKTIRVNHPLVVDGFSLYQEGFDIRADVETRIIHNGSIIWEGLLRQGILQEIPGRGLSFEIAGFIPDTFPLKDTGGDFMPQSCKSGKPALLVNIYKGKKLFRQQWLFRDKEWKNFSNGEFNFEIKNFSAQYSSLIEIVRDPGVPFVWTGFAGVCAGLFVLLLSKKVLEAYNV